MSIETLLEYRWREKLPVLEVKTGIGTPVHGRNLPAYVFPLSAPNPLNIRMGLKKNHVFAKSPRHGLHTIKNDVWGYAIGNDPITYPGPVLVATENQPVSITWKNELTEKFPYVHPMPDLDVPGIMMRRYSIGHAAVHMHGARVGEESDGYSPHCNAPPRAATTLRNCLASAPQDSSACGWPPAFSCVWAKICSRNSSRVSRGSTSTSSGCLLR
jgi:hypothetical protein